MSENAGLDDGAASPRAELVECWRCGLETPAVSSACSHCAARLRGAAISARAPASEQYNDLNLLFCTYALLLATGIIHAFVLNTTIDPEALGGPALRTRILTQILVVEAIDSVIILTALYKSRDRWKFGKPPQRTRIAAWIVSLPALAGLLSLNLGYHWLLRNVLHLPLLSDDLAQQFDLFAFLVLCLQPGVIEEAYCRWFALDNLREATGLHSAVWISATMFGLLHVAVLPSIPYLIVFGGVLGYLRVASGSLLLPIVLHVAHNVVILLLESLAQ